MFRLYLPWYEMVPLMLGRALLCGFVMMAFTEYAAHRWMLHRNLFTRMFPWVSGFKKVLIEHNLHHGRYFRCFNHEEHPEGKFVGIVFALGYYWLLWLFVAAPLLFVDWNIALGFAVWAFIHYKAWNELHQVMHFDEKPRAGLRLWFKLVKFNHFLHHQHPNKNFAGLLPPLWDVIFGTFTFPTREDRMVWRLLAVGQVVDRKGRPI